VKHRRSAGDHSPDPLQSQDPASADGALATDPRVADYLGAARQKVSGFADLLGSEGVKLGLIGPSEVGRLWSRHILNSAAVAPYLPRSGTFVDVGSGAGLPGIVLAALRPDLRCVLIEPMERRVGWLREVVTQLDLGSVEVVRGRAEELRGQITAEAVTARAVAPLSRLVPWTLPLLVPGGALLAMKGGRAADELREAEAVIRRAGGGQVEILTAETVQGVEPTTVVRIVRKGATPPVG
jgi:16S rRNA (guanine527-N7)-methyltransferase